MRGLNTDNKRDFAAILEDASERVSVGGLSSKLTRIN